MRGSSPVRMARGAEPRQSPGLVGVYPVGIISAAVDGLRTAKQIVAQFSPPGW